MLEPHWLPGTTSLALHSRVKLLQDWKRQLHFKHLDTHRDWGIPFLRCGSMPVALLFGTSWKNPRVGRTWLWTLTRTLKTPVVCSPTESLVSFKRQRCEGLSTLSSGVYRVCTRSRSVRTMRQCHGNQGAGDKEGTRRTLFLLPVVLCQPSIAVWGDCRLKEWAGAYPVHAWSNSCRGEEPGKEVKEVG